MSRPVSRQDPDPTQHPSNPIPIIDIADLWREYPSDEGPVAVLCGVNLRIMPGEMVAIVGASGSGKSTLMSILGCLDRPTRGSYHIAGKEMGTFSPDELARLRRERFGFIFQRYNLLGDLTATGNVEVPAIYSGLPGSVRRARAAALLRRLGLGERLGHRPGQLSGGQQQRVSIARALMNGGEVIFADEPTGALDSANGREVMLILRELHAEGHTVVLVTHDMRIAENADRIIEIADGRITSDRRRGAPPLAASIPEALPATGPGFTAWFGQTRELFRMAMLALKAHKQRSLLTMLGIVIGIASVVCVVAIGQASRERVLAEISGLGTNTIEIWSGFGWGDDADQRPGLRAGDAEALMREHYLSGVSPTIETSKPARYGNRVATADLHGVSEQYFAIKGIPIVRGSSFDADSVRRHAQEALVDRKALRALFPDGRDAIGEVILVGTLPVRIVGIVGDAPTIEMTSNVLLFVPYTTVESRLTGRGDFRSIVMRVRDGVSTGAAEQAVTHLLTMRRGDSEMFIANSDAIRKTTEKTARTMSLMVTAVAVISLVVGGIGVMNIMLVTVAQRASEIGVRMAIGARRRDIMSQFLIEAVLVCLTGGLLGIALAFGVTAAMPLVAPGFQTVIAPPAIAAAFGFSMATGLISGWLPARSAADLDPVRALARD